jgi:hypothetical protein
MRRILPLLASAVVALGVVTAVPATAASDQTAFHRWTTTGDFARGTAKGLTAKSGRMTVGTGTTVTRYKDPRVSGGKKSYDRGSWQSPWQSAGFGATSLIPSWSITTPGGTWARVEVRVRNGAKVGSWDTVARWAGSTSRVKRSSYSAQTDDLARVSTDTVVANAGQSFDRYQVRIVLHRPKGSRSTPTLHAVNAVAATYTRRTTGTSATTMTATTDLAVPQSSQMIHRGEFPQWGGGGEAWCSPTSTSMVMRYYGKGPAKSAYSWSRYADSFVDHAARYTYDHQYKGTGNWAFNTAYAAGYSLDTFVTRLDSLRDAEAFIRSGVPLVASVAFGRGQLTGSPISSTPGHLMVVRGFTAAGDVIVNDPAAAKNSSVRRVYSRAQFEKAWMGGSGGVVYVIRPAGTALPADTARW